MNEEDHTSIWESFQSAKQKALREEEPHSAAGEPRTLEELELAIAEAAAASGLPETGMPPRAVVHPSVRKNYSRWFYLLLVVLFTALVTGLVWWGRKHYAE